MMRWAAIILGVGTVALSGCAAVDDYHYCLVNHYRSDIAFKKCYSSQERRARSSDYASGWKHGYFDFSTGGSGEPPAVPPSRYWSPKYQTQKGHAAVEDWFVGYQDGATAAESSGNGAWHPIYTGPSIPTEPLGWPMTETFPTESSLLSETLPIAMPDSVFEQPFREQHVLQQRIFEQPVPRVFEPTPVQQPAAQQTVVQQPTTSVIAQEPSTNTVEVSPPVETSALSRSTETSGKSLPSIEELYPVPPVYTDE